MKWLLAIGVVAIAMTVGTAERDLKSLWASTIEQSIKETKSLEPQAHGRELQFTDGEDMIFLGDSWAFFATFLGGRTDFSVSSGYCQNGKGVRVIGEGVGGSTALDWAQKANRCAINFFAGLVSDGCNVDRILDQRPNANKVWLTVGGNDFFDNQCNADTDITASTTAVVQQILAKRPDMKILITGYAPPSCTPDIDGCVPSKLPGFRSSVQAQLEAISNSFSAVTWVEVYDLWDIPNSDFSDQNFYRSDCIHLNQEGYDQMWALPAIKNFICGPSIPTPNPTPLPTPRPTPQPVSNPVSNPVAAPVQAPSDTCFDVENTCLTFNDGSDAPCSRISTQFCDNPRVFLRCPAKCGTCQTGQCVDSVPSRLTFNNGCPAPCEELAQYCSQYEVVRERCPGTCNVCNRRLGEQRMLQEPTTADIVALPAEVTPSSSASARLDPLAASSTPASNDAEITYLIAGIGGVALVSLAAIAVAVIQYRRATALESAVNSGHTRATLSSPNPNPMFKAPTL